MRELSLFSGAGGGLLATKHLLGWETVGYVEFNEYCQRVLAARIADGYLDRAPIFGDIREFVQSGAAEQYRGFVDVVSGGFPCQPFSVAGQQKAGDDERNMWPATLDVLRAVRPRFAFLENVPGLLTTGYFDTVMSGLAEAGFDAKWCVLGADDCGAPHRRKRLWIVAHPNESGQRADRGDGQGRGNKTRYNPWGGGEDVADAIRSRGATGLSETRGGDERDSREPHHRCRESSWWARDIADNPESGVGRVVAGCANRLDRIRVLGNMQVPIVAATAWEILSQ